MATSSTSRTAKNVIVKNLAVFSYIFQNKYLPLVCQVPPGIFCHHSQKIFIWLEYDHLDMKSWKKVSSGKMLLRDYFRSKTFHVMNDSCRNWMKNFVCKIERNNSYRWHFLKNLFDIFCFPLDNPWKNTQVRIPTIFRDSVTSTSGVASRTW